jgi:antitoxin (DNA-binding transcriptional repressor) of toxin-antitoxin stability system
MPKTIEAAELQQHLDEVLARAADGEHIVVRSADGREVTIGPRQRVWREGPRQVRRRRHRSERTVAEVLAEDRGA